jgi:hypothetical protein
MLNKLLATMEVSKANTGKIEKLKQNPSYRRISKLLQRQEVKDISRDLKESQWDSIILSQKQRRQWEEAEEERIIKQYEKDHKH